MLRFHPPGDEDLETAATHNVGAAELLFLREARDSDLIAGIGLQYRLSDEKGYGFITPDDGGEDLFVYHSAIAGHGFGSLAEGAKVSYDTEQGRKGPAAASVRLI